MEYIINFDHVYTAQDLHNAFRKLPLPDYYGNNLDALYDVLCEIGEPTMLTIKNVEELPASYQDLVMQLFEDVMESNKLINVNYIK